MTNATYSFADCLQNAYKVNWKIKDVLGGRDVAAPDALGVIDDRDQLERAFRRLSVDHRAVVVLHHYEGLPMRDVATALGIAEGTAHSRLDRAMKKLRIALVGDIPARGPMSEEATS